MPKRFLWKAVSVAAITFGLLIPLTMIRVLVDERSNFRKEARDDIARSWTGAQRVIGPVLTIPYSIPFEETEEKPTGATVRRERILLPEELAITSEVETELRRRGLHDVPVYRSALTIRGSFETGLASVLADNPKLVLGDATLSLVVSDNRGIAATPVLRWNGEPRELRSGSALAGIAGGIRSDVGDVRPERGERFDFEMTLELRGMENLSFVPIGRDTHVAMSAAWLHPSFTGRFLPAEYAIEDGAFQAEWSVSHLATDPATTIENLAAGRAMELENFGVSLITPVDIYQQASRSVKYGTLFIVLTFTAFFLVEFSRRLNFHAVQYLLIGLALVIFFLLLLSISEHLPFARAYAVAATACIVLIGAYISASARRFSSSFSIVAVLGGLYGMLYVILRSEDNALLMGSLLLFAALAAVMIVTRRVDWNGLLAATQENAGVQDSAPR